MTSGEPTPLDVAKFMRDRMEESGDLYQEDIVGEIHDRFGEAFLYENENGNLAIGRPVLDEFRKLTPDCVWDRSERCWRAREDHDEPGRGQP